MYNKYIMFSTLKNMATKKMYKNISTSENEYHKLLNSCPKCKNEDSEITYVNERGYRLCSNCGIRFSSISDGYNIKYKYYNDNEDLLKYY